MYNQKPVQSKLLARKWLDQDRLIHMRRLIEMKSSLQIKEPKRFKHLDYKSKRYQLQEERYTEIERENRILLEKMTTIMAAKPKLNQTSRSIVLRSFNHNRNNSMSQRSTGRRKGSFSSSVSSSSSRMSLNSAKRERERQKIQQENIQILQRLRSKKSVYNAYQWEKDNIERQKRLFNIAEFPRPTELPTIKAVKNKAGYVKIKIVPKKSTNLFVQPKSNLLSRQSVNKRPRQSVESQNQHQIWRNMQNSSKRYKSTGHATNRGNRTLLNISHNNYPSSLLNHSLHTSSQTCPPQHDTMIHSHRSKKRPRLALPINHNTSFDKNTKYHTQQIQKSSRRIKASEREKLRFQYESEVFIKKVMEQQPLVEVEDQTPPLKYHVSIHLLNKKRSKLVIKAMHMDGSGDYYDIVIEGQQKIRDMISHFNYSYQLICDHLRIMNNRMILLNPEAVRNQSPPVNNNNQQINHPDKTEELKVEQEAEES